ncbi:MAG: DUF2786 domain-containing protein [Ilumatobacteraceae bacterium]
MGRNSQQRRARQQRQHTRQHPYSAARGSADEPSLDDLLAVACHVAYGPGADKVVFGRATLMLQQLEAEADPLDRPSTRVSQLLREVVESALESGWQPADLAHVARRAWTLRISRLAVAFLAEHARRVDAVTRAPQRWLGQLQDLGVLDPAGTAILGGRGDLLAGWARAEKLHPEEALSAAIQFLAQMRALPRLPLAVSPPSKWGASNRGSVAPASTGEIDEKALRLIRALLSKAEATDFEAEAESFTAKAQELMTRYSIDAAVMAAADHGTGHARGIESRRVHIDNPYSDEKATFLSAIASVNSVRAIWMPAAGFSTVMGFPVDLQLTDLLFTSLMVQATHASSAATRHDPRLRTPSFRRAFLIAFADRIAERLESTRQHVAEQAESELGGVLVPILADRMAAVDAAYEAAFPNATVMKSRRLNAAGWHAGRAAADAADIGAGAAISSG